MRRTQRQCAFLVIAVLSGFAGVAGGQSLLKMDAVAGFNGHAKPGRWMPVRVTVENLGAATDGTLSLRFASDTRTAQFYTTGSLPTTSRKQFFLYALADEMTQGEVRLNARGARPVPVNVLPDADFDQLVLAVSSEGEGGLSYIAGVRGVGRPPVNAPGRYYGAPTRAGQGSATHVAYAKPGELPDRWLGYDALDVVVLQNFSPRDFAPEQVNALRTWVEGGGTLVVCGGSNWQRLAESFVTEMLPGGVTGSQVLSSAPRLTARYGASQWSGAPLVVSRLKVRGPGSGRVLVEDSGVPLIAVRDFGAGQVVYLAFDPTKPPIAGWEGSHAMWRDVLTWAGSRPVLLNAHEETLYPQIGFRRGYVSAQSGGSLSAALMNIPSMQAPPFKFIGLFLCLYIVFLVPVNYFVLKKVGRRELAWVTTPFIVLVFTCLSYGVGFSIKGGTLRVNKLTVVQSRAGAARGAAETLFGIFSPSKTGYTLTTVDDEGAVSDLLPESYSTEQSSLTVREDQKMMVEDYRINMWAMKLFRARAVVNLGKGVTAQFQRNGGALQATVRNGTPYDFPLAALIVGRQVVALKAVNAGGTATARVPAASPSGMNVLQQLVNASGVAQGSDQQRNLRNAAMRTLLSDEGTGVGMDLLAEGALFVGWTAQDALAVNIVGHRPQVEQSTLVVVRLPPDILPLASAKAATLVPGRIIASNVQELSQQHPGVVQLEQGQELVYEFRLPIRAGRVSVARLWVQAEVAGTAPSLSAYNFARHRYDSLNVESSSGQVRRYNYQSPRSSYSFSRNTSQALMRLSPVSPYLLLPDGVVRVRVRAKGQAQLFALKVGFRGDRG